MIRHEKDAHRFLPQCCFRRMQCWREADSQLTRWAVSYGESGLAMGHHHGSRMILQILYEAIIDTVLVMLVMLLKEVGGPNHLKSPERG